MNEDTDFEVLCECPICFQRWPQNAIDLHVDLCLKTTAEDEAERCPGINKRHAKTCSPKVENMASQVIKEDLSGTDDQHTSTDLAPCFSTNSKRKRFDIASWLGTSPTSVSPNVHPKRLLSSSGGSPLAHTFVHSRKKCMETVGATDSEALTPKRPSFPSEPVEPLPEPSCSTKANGRNGQSWERNQQLAPLAAKMIPTCLDQYVGQEHIMKDNAILRTLIDAHTILSMVLWGPPGCGKTSLANVIANHCREKQDSRFVTLSAANAGVAAVKQVIDTARNDWALLKRRTILFIDEIHRFNKLQQDTFLPFVENGTVTLIGATTENPSFSLNSALLSRCRVFTLEKLTVRNVEDILFRAIKNLNLSITRDLQKAVYNHEKPMSIEMDAITELAHLSDGDARVALNCLQLAVDAMKSQLNRENIVLNTNDMQSPVITVRSIRENLQRTHLLYDRKGDEHFNCISALHKSMRGSDADAALYWLGRMLEGGEDPLYIARRLIRFASEDIGLADYLALPQAVAAYQACHFIGMPECEVNLAQCVVYLAKAPKSISVYSAYSKVKQCIKLHQGPLPGVPLHLRNAPTKLMKDLGYANRYKYNPIFSEPVDQTYLPNDLVGIKFLD